MLVTDSAPNPYLLTVPEAAQLLRISRNLAYELIKRGELPHVRLGERIIRVPRHALEHWLEQQAAPRQHLIEVLSLR